MLGSLPLALRVLAFKSLWVFENSSEVLSAPSTTSSADYQSSFIAASGHSTLYPTLICAIDLPKGDNKMVPWTTVGKVGLSAFEIWTASKKAHEEEAKKKEPEGIEAAIAEAILTGTGKVAGQVKKILSSPKAAPRKRSRSRRDSEGDKDVSYRRRNPHRSSRDRNTRSSDRSTPRTPRATTPRDPRSRPEGRRGGRRSSSSRTPIPPPPMGSYFPQMPPAPSEMHPSRPSSRRRPCYYEPNTPPAPLPTSPTLPNSVSYRPRPSPTRPAPSTRPSYHGRSTAPEPSSRTLRPRLPRQSSYQPDRTSRPRFPQKFTPPTPTANTRSQPPRRGSSYVGSQSQRPCLSIPRYAAPPQSSPSQIPREDNHRTSYRGGRDGDGESPARRIHEGHDLVK